MKIPPKMDFFCFDFHAKQLEVEFQVHDVTVVYPNSSCMGLC